MEKSVNEAAAGGNEDGLNELLDSALNDFNKPLPKAAKQMNKSPTDAQEVKASTAETKSAESTAWSEEFKQFSEVMENFLEDESEINELRNLMGNLSQGSALANDENFAETFADRIREITEGIQTLPEPTPDELANLLSGLGMGDPNQPDGDQIPELMPLMQNVMQKLMSKELLYPSLKEIVDKYPEWLSDKRSSLKEQEYEMYNQQYNLMKSVCDEFEKEGNDSEEAKKETFEKVLDLMQKIQNCGNPPKELVSDVGQTFPLDEHGNLQIPGMPQQCAIM